MNSIDFNKILNAMYIFFAEIIFSKGACVMKMRYKNGRYVPNKTATYGLSVKKSLHSRGLLHVYTSVAFLARNLPLAP